MNEENELDDLFKKKLQDPVDNESYNEADWDDMEQLLDKPKKRRGVVYWLPIYGSVAALLLLFLGYMVFRPKTANTKPGNNPQATVIKSAHSGTSGEPIRQQSDQSPKVQKQTIIAQNLAGGKRGADRHPFQPSSADGAPRTAGVTQQDIAGDAATRSNELLTAQGTAYILGSAYIAVEPVANHPLSVNNGSAAILEKKKPNITMQNIGYRPQLTLSIIAAPDLNGVGSFQQSKVGTNEGLLFSVGLSRKLTVSTGAVYSVKPYITGFENYHTGYQFPVDPIHVTADCRMLDIPINIGYQVFHQHQNSISVGTGLSSYIMLHENFKFNYANTYYTGPAQYTVPNSAGYYFGILNLNATFQHQVNSKVGFSVQPYIKLPLTTVGYSQVRLQTTGVALGLTWNLNSSARP